MSHSEQTQTALEPDAAPQQAGDAAVDAALAELDRLAGLPVEEHVAVYESVHAQLRDRLVEGTEPTSAGER